MARLNHIKNCDIQKEMEADLYNIQLSFSEYNFKANTDLFFSKWSYGDTEMVKFLDYLRTEWVNSKTSGW